NNSSSTSNTFSASHSSNFETNVSHGGGASGHGGPTPHAGDLSRALGHDAHVPKPGDMVSKQDQQAEIAAASKELEHRAVNNEISPAQHQAALKGLNEWQHLLDEGHHATPDGAMMRIPDSLPGIAAGGNYNVAGGDIAGASQVQQGMN